MMLAGAFALLLSIALLAARRATTGTVVCALQAFLVALALAAAVPAAALLGFALNGIALPLCFRQFMPPEPPAPRRSPGFWLAAFAIVAVSLVVFHRLAAGAAIVLLGLLLVAQGPSPVLGLLSAQNGILLVAGSIPEMPPATLLASAVPLLPAMFLAESWLRR
jgi:hypothetical protein